MSEQFTQPVDGGGFHFEITDPVLSEPKIGEAVYQGRVADPQSQDPALRPIESGAGNGDALVKILYKVFDQGSCPAADIRVTGLPVDLGMGDKGVEELFFFVILFMPVEIEQVINAKAMGGGDEAVNRDIFLEGARGAQADDIEMFEFVTRFTSVKIDIGERVEFVHHYIYIIWSDTGGKDGKSFFADITGMADEFAVLSPDFDAVKMFADFPDAVGVADGDNGAGDLFGAKVEMVNGSPGIDDQF